MIEWIIILRGCFYECYNDLASDCYQNLMQYIPDGKLLVGALCDGIPRITYSIDDNTKMRFFGIMLALIFAIVKINRVKIYIPITKLFVSFLKELQF